MDFDATKEIWRFFSQYELNTLASEMHQKTVEVGFWPNPASKEITVQAADNYLITEIAITDLSGRLIEKMSGGNIQFIDLDHLKAGNYLLKMSGNGFTISKKLVIQNN
jgi:hypothetical protein